MQRSAILPVPPYRAAVHCSAGGYCCTQPDTTVLLCSTSTLQDSALQCSTVEYKDTAVAVVGLEYITNNIKFTCTLAWSLKSSISVSFHACQHKTRKPGGERNRKHSCVVAATRTAGNEDNYFTTESPVFHCGIARIRILAYSTWYMQRAVAMLPLDRRVFFLYSNMGLGVGIGSYTTHRTPFRFWRRR